MLEKLENMMKECFFFEKKNGFIFLKAKNGKAQNMLVVDGRLNWY